MEDTVDTKHNQNFTIEINIPTNMKEHEIKNHDDKAILINKFIRRLNYIDDMSIAQSKEPKNKTIAEDTLQDQRKLFMQY